MNDSSLSFSIENDPKAEHSEQVLAGLVASNGSRLETEDRRPLGVFVQEADEIVGGVDGYTHWHWLYVSHLWVRDDLRHGGIGRRLMELMEGEALRRGCGAAWLDTFDFQAPDFYESIGYRVFGRLPDFPPGGSRVYLWKRLGD
jgi:ribosomal protein S18 acetylase RimI-like enzyme